MLIACWGAKGGSGTTVVAVALASLATRTGGSALLADLAGDVPAALGLASGPPPGPGLVDWLAAAPDVPADALHRLEVDAGSGLAVIPRGDGELPTTHGEELAAHLAADRRTVVVDCGSAQRGVPLAVASAAGRSVLVIRPCYLALRRALAAPVRPSEVVLVDEPGRALDAGDVEALLEVPVRAVVTLDPAVARAVDAGLLLTRFPRSLERGLRRAA